jgi:cell division protein FtsB
LLDQIAAIVRVELAQLSAITLPESIAAEFAADLERREAELAELEAEAKALRSGDLAEAARLDLSILPVNQAMRQFQAAHRFADCP